MRVLIAPDKFKGSLSAREVAAALAAGFAHFPGFIIDCCPVADGGEGFAEVLAARRDTVEGIRDPIGRLVTAACGWLEGGTALIEMSDASGLDRLTAQDRDPWRASTFGTGQLIRHASLHGATRMLVGLGGSATNDAGAGMAAALGWQFLTSDGEPVDPIPANFLAIERIEAPEEDTLPPIVAACDVRNPLLGPEGASRIYARQKGADERMIGFLEMAVEHLADLVADQIGTDHRNLPGAGAAGGLGYGLATFCQAELQPGFALIAQALRLEERVAASDMVITGEGRIDAQTLNGKAPGEVARLAKKFGKPVAAVCGELAGGTAATEWFDSIITLRSLDPSGKHCFSSPAELLASAAAIIARRAREAS